ncbi:MAG: methylated-DNA--[protein]-cysteine S-methyltransferase [Thiobacillus sp.]|jgi:methylated-DNA-[protein]-cysteine S-methyltransferase|uniref:methylated-DNA--[protein]-cysteine S-methyltransferase n=1 Tax=Thiobacillus sp. TaxID=924 RepID=UPI002894D3D7|nr:methylated-DNA--[protein]-cysteine S-methyltransferase [Thiobacillus sp.]MDT3705641.1 methylated-DNA--[protein]-cysteine S-methyltransferase [Thiobacillus sp.]
MHNYDFILAAPMCHLGARFTGDALTQLDFLPTDLPTTPLSDTRARRLARELEAYWHNPAHSFDLLFVPLGTPFQLRVWHALMNIPAGHPTTYGALAKQLDTAARAVGQACGANPLPLLIPCHRVVAASGLGGFMHAASGAPLDVKTWLLAHESRSAPRKPSAPSLQPSPTSGRGRGRNARND